MFPVDFSELEEQYPGDVGLFAPLLLNVITPKAGASHVSRCRDSP
ncbi:hypothetical protein O9992_21305 [Vibrio lentus]|nr:hypothetical protein [Vibrio lentus]